MTPPVETGNDVQLLESVLQTQLRGPVLDLRVLIHEGGIILHGRCTSYHVKQRAQHSAMKLGRVPILADRIEVTSYVKV